MYNLFDHKTVKKISQQIFNNESLKRLGLVFLRGIVAEASPAILGKEGPAGDGKVLFIMFILRNMELWFLGWIVEELKLGMKL